MWNKKGYLKTILVISIALILLIILGSLLYIWKTENQNPIQTIKKVVDDIVTTITQDAPKDDPPTQINPPLGPSGGAGGGSSSGGGSGSSSGGGTSIPGCTYLSASYGLVNYQESFVCNLYDGEICLDKTVNCSIGIQNMENQDAINLEVRLTFVEKGKDVLIEGFGISEKSFMVEAGTIETFYGGTNIVSTGIDGLANKEINCYFNTINRPYKEVCP